MVPFPPFPQVVGVHWGDDVLHFFVDYLLLSGQGMLSEFVRIVL